MIDCPAVDAVEVCTPNYLHVPMAEYAVEAGKPVNVEKPLALKVEDAENLDKMVRERNHPNMMCFSYRFMPGVRYAKHIIDRGLIGKIISINVEYLKDSGLQEGRRLEWRFVKECAGSGVIGDLAVHLIDLAQLLAGNITSLVATQSIIVKQRQRLDSDEFAPVQTDDQCGFLAEFSSGAQGTFCITRAAAGHANTIRYDVYGTRGAISFDLDHPEILSICVGEGDVKNLPFKTVDVPREFYLDQERAFVNALGGKVDDIFPTLKHGAQGQLIVDAIIKSAAERRWVDIEE
jgi:predicted dehydrogenase